MTINFICQSCKKKVKAPETAGGKWGSCPHCNLKCYIPLPPAPEEEELKLIALERDQISPDRFDKLIKDCAILDIDESISAKDLFHKASKVMSERMDVDAEHLYELFLEREKESTTIVKPGLAIPHIVIDGNNKFDVLLVRCEKGIVFSELYEPVRTAFILIGSSDERNYHLRALMSIAHVVSEDEFQGRWFKARNIEQLRDIVLLSGRKRD